MSRSDKPVKNSADLFVVLDKESGAVEYGPSPGDKAAKLHLAKLQELDQRGSLAEGVGRELGVFKLVEA